MTRKYLKPLSLNYYFDKIKTMGILNRLIKILYLNLMHELNSSKWKSYSKTSDDNYSKQNFYDYYERYKEYYKKYYNRNKDNYYKNYNGYSGKNNYNSQSSDEEQKLAQYYANLELPFKAPMDEVKKAWKRLLLKYHPDKHADIEKNKTATILTQKLNEAYFYIEKYWKNKKL